MAVSDGATDIVIHAMGSNIRAMTGDIPATSFDGKERAIYIQEIATDSQAIATDICDSTSSLSSRARISSQLNATPQQITVELLLEHTTAQGSKYWKS